MYKRQGYIKIDGEVAEMRSYTIEAAVLPDGKELRPCGQYDDTCILEDGEWKFSRRCFTNLYGE